MAENVSDIWGRGFFEEHRGKSSTGRPPFERSLGGEKARRSLEAGEETHLTPAGKFEAFNAVVRKFQLIVGVPGTRAILIQFINVNCAPYSFLKERVVVALCNFDFLFKDKKDIGFIFQIYRIKIKILL
ncbi:hypothetical protein ACRC6Q_04375 [Planococcus sp. SE5232]|uniref:hypothetical protein n=1 Tax=unclassified Planococcus (in: firmicutes) TaxID=2662419 RepID=UPI003D6AAAC2